jgi:hypothetical protein
VLGQYTDLTIDREEYVVCIHGYYRVPFSASDVDHLFWLARKHDGTWCGWNGAGNYRKGNTQGRPPEFLEPSWATAEEAALHLQMLGYFQEHPK